MRVQEEFDALVRAVRRNRVASAENKAVRLIKHLATGGTHPRSDYTDELAEALTDGDRDPTAFPQTDALLTLLTAGTETSGGGEEG